MPNWRQILDEITKRNQTYQRNANLSSDFVRRKYLKQLHRHTERNIIAYYSGWLSKPGIQGSEINDEDKNGFMMAVNMLDRSKGLDLILHTPGGSIAAAESIVNYLRKMFNIDIRAIIPQIAMSAGTMIACACKKILMAKHSNLGPIDPHLNGIPAQGVIDEFARAHKEIQADNTRLAVWQFIIGKYQPTFLSQCENSVKWSKEFVKNQLKEAMFGEEADSPEKDKKIIEIVNRLTNYQENKSHEKHIHYEECEEIGLDVELIEDDSDLQDLILTVHHCYMHTLMNTPSYKIIENHLGTALVKHHVTSQK